jgi:phenylacetate-CoA ligase
MSRPAREGLIVNEDVLLEIVRPGTGDPVAEGEVGEIVVTSFNEHHPWIRLATGDLSAMMKGASPCGRTNARIKGWMGRADQTTKVKGMFVRPEQIAELSRQHPGLQKLRLVVTRENEQDAMTLRAESANGGADLSDKVAATLQAVTKLKGRVETRRGRLIAQRWQGDLGRAGVVPICASSSRKPVPASSGSGDYDYAKRSALRV